MSQRTRIGGKAFFAALLFTLLLSIFAYSAYEKGGRVDPSGRVGPSQTVAGERPPAVTKSTGDQPVIARSEERDAAISPFRHRLSESYKNSGVLSMDDRLLCQEQIERVYHKKRIWPKDNPEPKPAFEKMIPRESIEKKVGDTVKKCALLDEYWQRPITGEQLQAEMDRMVRQTKDPEGLKELFAALNNDPRLIAECLARPVLADRLIRNWYAHDERFHGELKSRVLELQKTLTSDTFENYTEGEYRKIKLVAGEKERDFHERDFSTMTLQKEEFALEAAKFPRKQGEISFEETSDAFILRMVTVTPLFVEPICGSHLQMATGPAVAAHRSQEKIPTEDGDIPTSVILRDLRSDALEGSRLSDAPADGETVEGACRVFTKRPCDDWFGAICTNSKVVGIICTAQFAFTIPESGVSGDFSPDSWLNESYTPEPRYSHTAVWTGNEMIVWGGLLTDNTDTGGRYSPTLDTWTPTSLLGAPTPRHYHTAVWTGSEMIIWGGCYSNTWSVDTGARYNPTKDYWTALPRSGAPSARYYHTAVWTGLEMVVWGGTEDRKSCLADGGRFSPSTNSWLPLSTAGKPTGRVMHTAVWTGDEMMVWGGIYLPGWGAFASGGRYNPATDSWTAISTVSAPEARGWHTAVWTGREMVVWGGGPSSYDVKTGGRYNPSLDKWTATSTEGAPDPRSYHLSVWTGEEVIVWGGYRSSQGVEINTGGRYNPRSDSWLPTSIENAPTPRFYTSGIWTGEEFIVWGGFLATDTGGRYNPTRDAWLATATSSAPTGRGWTTAIWTGAEMIVWGGNNMSEVFNTGSRYEPALDLWTPTSTEVAPSARRCHTAIWTGTEMVIWGGDGWTPVDSGGRYRPDLDSWVPTSTTGPPSPRIRHTAVWTGTEMIVWGGSLEGTNQTERTGGRYRPDQDSWHATSLDGAPESRDYHSMVWTGKEAIVWGGSAQNHTIIMNTGGRYDPVNDLWVATSREGVLSARNGHTAIWTGAEMVVWGGLSNSGVLRNGARYSPGEDKWTSISASNAPTARASHSAVWTGKEMIIWGGFATSPEIHFLSTGARYQAGTDSWLSMNASKTPSQRSNHCAVWTGREMLVWGGAPGTAFGAYLTDTAPASAPTIRIDGEDTNELHIGGGEAVVNLGHSLPTDWSDDVEGTSKWDAVGDWAVIYGLNCSGVSDFYSPAHAWRFGTKGSCGYAGPSGTSTLTSKLEFPVEEDTIFSFRYFLQTDPAKGDTATVELSADGGVTWVTLGQDASHWLSDGGESRSLSMLDSCEVWRAAEFYLARYISPGSSVRIRFSFTRDAYYNDRVGWILDDICIGKPSGDGSNPTTGLTASDGSSSLCKLPMHDAWDRATFEWDLNGDGIADNIDTKVPLWNIPESELQVFGLHIPGEHRLTLKVTDSLGGSKSESVVLKVLDGQSPSVSLATPNGGESWEYSPDTGGRKKHMIVWNASDKWGIGRVRLSYATKETPADSDWACIADSGEVGESGQERRDPSEATHLLINTSSENPVESNRHSRVSGNPGLNMLDSGSPPDQAPGLAGMTATKGSIPTIAPEAALVVPFGMTEKAEDTSKVQRDPSRDLLRSGLRMTDDGESVRRTTGEDGSCASADLDPSDTSFLWEMPTKAEAALPGQTFPSSQARVRVEVWDSSGNRAESVSDRTFYIIQPSAAAIQSLLLMNRGRVEALYPGRSEALWKKLGELAAHEKVNGVVLDLANVPGLAGLYEAWDAAPADHAKANAVVEGIRGYVKGQVAQAYSNARYVVLAGDDRMVPMYRADDGTKTYPESNYSSQVDCSSATGSAICGNMTLTDNPYGDLGDSPEVTKTDFGKMYLPQLAVGRLVETPEEMMATVDTYIAQNGQVSFDRAMVSGYDFVKDGAQEMAGALGVSRTDLLIGDDWDGAQLDGLLFSTPPHSLNGINGHSTHFGLGVPGGGTLSASSMDASHGGEPLRGAVVFNVGCHGGLNVPDSWDASKHPLDLPQLLLGKGAAACVGNTGFGWGLRYGVGYGERMMSTLADTVASQPGIGIGDALTEAKREYFLANHRYDVFDEKVLFETTLYGLPMYQVVAGAGVGGGGSSGPNVRDVPEEGGDLRASGPGLQSAGGITVKKSVESGPPSHVTELALNFSFGEDTYSKHLTSDGRHYYALHGKVNGEIGEVLQPLFDYDSRLSGTTCRGVAFAGGSFTGEGSYTPVVGAPASSDADPGEGPLAPGMGGMIGTIGAITVKSSSGPAESAGQDFTRLTVYTGFYDGEKKTENLFRQMSFLVYYNDDDLADQTLPVLSDPGPGGVLHRMDGTTANFSVGVTDPAGVYRVIIAYSDLVSSWQVKELALSQASGRWEGSLDLAGPVAYFAQAVDGAGNVNFLKEEGDDVDGGGQKTGTTHISPRMFTARAGQSGALPGDCDGDGAVGIGEVQKAINMFLGILAPGCGADCTGNGDVSIGELQKVINAFLGSPSSCE